MGETYLGTQVVSQILDTLHIGKTSDTRTCRTRDVRMGGVCTLQYVVVASLFWFAARSVCQKRLARWRRQLLRQSPVVSQLLEALNACP